MRIAANGQSSAAGLSCVEGKQVGETEGETALTLCYEAEPTNGLHVFGFGKVSRLPGIRSSELLHSPSRPNVALDISFFEPSNLRAGFRGEGHSIRSLDRRARRIG